MLCKIADLIVEIPAAGGLAPRCQEYLYKDDCQPNIVICSERYKPEKYSVALDEHGVAYMESARQFYAGLLGFYGFYLHSSAIKINDRAYLFSGPSGIGKSTHTRQWQKVFGEKVQVFNDDKPALRRLEEGWFAYGTPWCGKDGINLNMKVPLGGVCFLKQATENHIRRLNSVEAVQKILPQTIYRFHRVSKLDLLLNHIDKLVREIPIFELENRPEPEAAMLSYETMRRAAEEAGL